jgi:UDP-N-acetylmuramoylalanine--D-glutamate ligase
MRSVLELNGWADDWLEQRVLVLGLGVAGFAIADTMWELGAEVLVVTSSANSEQVDILKTIGVKVELVETEETGVRFLKDFAPTFLAVSPGINPGHPVVVAATKNTLPILSEIELAWRLRDKVKSSEWVLVTGTNGKTTTTQLTALMLEKAGYRVAPVGNIGTPVLDAIRDPAGFDYLVVELSSFQLHWLPTEGPGALVPSASTILNIADDHLDWHGSAEAYRSSKAKVFTNTKKAVVYNRADQATLELAREADVVEGCEAIGFGLLTPDIGELGTIEGLLVDRAFVSDRRNNAQELYTVDRLAERGMATPHMIANVLAAAGLALASGANSGAIASAIDEFTVDHHRCETVLESSGVTWVDDSKATNAHAANASLRAFPSIVWIVGGLLKGTQLDEVVQAHASRLRGIVVIGVDREEPMRAMTTWAEGVPLVEIDAEDVMSAAVAAAQKMAKPGDTVLLAPAAASMDQFVDYGDRGDRFKAAVLSIVGEPK